MPSFKYLLAKHKGLNYGLENNPFNAAHWLRSFYREQ